MALDREREVALDAARRAGVAIMAIRREGFAVDFKDAHGDDPVTAADRAANRLIVDTIRAAFPDDVIVAEEDPVPEGFAAARRCWFVDPIDGTKEFVAGIGEFCVMVGLAIDGRAAMGVVVVPALPLTEGAPLGYALFGEVGRGAEVIDAAGHARPIHVSPASDPATLRFVVSRTRRSPRLDGIFGLLGAPTERPCGSVGVKIAKLVLDEADAYVHPAGGKGGPKLWDLCAPEAIIRAAGGVFTDERGNTIDYAHPEVAHDTGMVVASPAMHRAVLDAIARAGLSS